MVDSSKPTLGYWKIRGLASQVRHVFNYCKVDFNDVQYEQGDAPEYSRDCWMSVKESIGLEFPNLPYLVDGDVKITESQAILRYVVNKYGPHLNGKTPEEQAQVDQLYLILVDIKAFASGNCYSTGDKELITKNSIDKLAAVDRHLKGKKYCVGDYITFVDFQIIETMDLLNFCSDNRVFETYPDLKALYERICDVPEIKEYMSSDRFVSRPHNNKVAKLNN
ncbi:glutathione s-transferase [Stylonychia lemnae]|uniref:glutathione transferase n=1 Tax=Stylonychia lemnae TaxID=5949 RepID=A0A078BBT6_STYLE|nr:glutathione s-transferase [Stylonychia lemnae]|eukprot:CDW91671.1 glutathione s-transferase [Stylonychia lemnae]